MDLTIETSSPIVYTGRVTVNGKNAALDFKPKSVNIQHGVWTPTFVFLCAIVSNSMRICYCFELEKI